MPDKQNHNDSLERLFQKKAEEYDIAFREEDWHRMEQKLNLRDARLSTQRKMRRLAAAAVLIIGLLGYFTYDNHNRLNELKEQLAGDQSEQQLPPVAQFPVIPEPGHDDPPSRPEDPVGAATVTPEVTGLSEADEKYETGFDRPELREVEAERFAVRQSLAPVTFAGFEPETTTLTAPSVYPSVGGSAAPAIRSTLSTLHQPEQPYTEQDFGKALSRFSITVAASPDLSTVGNLSNFHDPGYKFGLMVEYAVTERISVSAGVVQTMVRYAATSDRYNPPVYWADGQAPAEMTAECLLFDIPLNIRFNVMNFGQSRFFTTAGLSSYIMQQEDYYFDYGNGSDGRLETWSGRTGTRHWFSNAGFSIGYEYDIHPNWSLRAEPFLKVPLREVGWGNAKLYSMGSYISLNYRL